MILCHVFFLEDLIIMWEIYKKGFPIKWKEFQSISPPPSSAQHGTSESDIDRSNSPSCNIHSRCPKIQQCGQVFLNWKGLRCKERLTLGMSPADPWKWKWSDKCRTSEISLLWCISTTNNVKSCKKFNETAQTANFTEFSLTSCGNGP